MQIRRSVSIVSALSLVTFSSLVLISPSKAEEVSYIRSDSASRFELLAEYAPGAQYKGKPLVNSIFNTYTNSNSEKDSLVIREDFEALFIASDEYVFVTPYGKTPVTIATNQNRTTINSTRQYVLAQGQAALRWASGLSCSFIFGANGRLDYESSIPIDIKNAIEFSSESDYQELRGLPGLSGRGGGGPINGPWVSSEQWFEKPINFSIDTENLNSELTEESPSGNLIFRIPKEELSDQFGRAGNFDYEYGVKCNNALDVGYNFISTQKLQVKIMPKSGIVKFAYKNPGSVSINDKAIDFDVSSPNTTSLISFKSLSPNTCAAFATSVLFKKIGTCNISINQGGNEDFASIVEKFSFQIVKPIVCVRGKSVLRIASWPQKCPAGYKKN